MKAPTAEVKDFLQLSAGESAHGRDILYAGEKQRVIEALSADPSLTAGQTLKIHTAGTLGSKDSAHDVFFASTTPRNYRDWPKVFACKRFRRSDSAEGEMKALEEAKARGFKTLEPQGEGIYTVQGIGHILVTKHIPRFTTMNYIGWQDFSAGDEEYDRRIAAPLREIGEFVGKMHKAGIVHNDLLLKNIAQVPPNNFVLFDLEGTTFHEPIKADEPLPFDHLGNIEQDLITLTRSLVAKGFLWQSTDEVFKQEIKSNLYEPYLEASGIYDDSLFEKLDFSILEAGVELRPEVHSGFALQAVTPT